jgi:methionyl-tRNA formyltransferase
VGGRDVTEVAGSAPALDSTPMRLLFAGTPEVALPTLRALLASPHEVVAVLTRPPAPAGRGRSLTPSAVASLGEEHGVEVLTPATLRAPEVRERLEALDLDCAPVVAYGALVPPALLDVPRHGWVNLHFSLLPAWRGAAPVQHAILQGDEVTGATTFRLEEGLDTGPVYGVQTETIRAWDTSGDLLDRLSRSGAQLMLATLDAIEQGLARPVPQPDEGVSLAPRLTSADGRLDWSEPALALDRRARACTPDPGAWTTFRGARLRLGPLRPHPDRDGLEPGELQVRRNQVLVGTGSYALELGQLAAAGKGWMPADAWARGARPGADERLGQG